LLNPWFITGIVDGEGSFMIKFRKHPKYRFPFLSSLLSRPMAMGLRITVRNYSATNSSVATPRRKLPVKIYNNMDLDKFNVVLDNKGKSGIYRMTNLTNNKTYIGSSVNLSHRFTCYYSFKHIKR
jgi:hypothetical protein